MAMPDTRYPIPDTRYPIPDTRYRLPRKIKKAPGISPQRLNRIPLQKCDLVDANLDNSACGIGLSAERSLR